MNNQESLDIDQALECQDYSHYLQQSSIQHNGALSPTQQNNNENRPECRICFGKYKPLIQPCLCKGSMANVHQECLRKWLESRPTMQCDICHFTIKQSLKLKSFKVIFDDVTKLVTKKLFKDKLLIFKGLIYSMYVIISCKKAVACFRLLVRQLRQKYTSTSQTMLSLLYILFVLIQLFVFSTHEIHYVYKHLKLQLRLVCYQITYKSRDLRG